MREERNMTKEVFFEICHLFDQKKSIDQVSITVNFSVSRIGKCKEAYDKSRLGDKDEEAWEFFQCEKTRHRLWRKLNINKITGAKGKVKFVSRPRSYPLEIW